MAVREELVLDLRGALGQIQTLEREIDDLRRPVDIPVDIRGDAPAEIRSIDERLEEIEAGASRVNSELSEMELAASRSAADFSDMARAMNISEDEARDLSREILEARNHAERVADSAREVARAMGLSESEANQFARAVATADRQAEKLAGSLREADRAADAIDVTTVGLAGRFSALRTSVAQIAGLLAGVGGATVFAAGLVGANAAIQSFATLEDSINAVNVVFKEGANIVRDFGETADRSAGLSETAFNQAVVPIGALLQNFGFDAREAAEASVVLIQRSADLASIIGGPVQDAVLAVGAALRGEADPLERYGASISAARVEQFALANGLAQTRSQITPAITLQARYGLILQDTADAAGDFARTSGDLANAQRVAGASAQEFGTDIGEVLAPALEEILVLLPEVLEGVRQLVPGFAAAGDSAASFFTSVGQGGGFRTEFALLQAGLESVFGVQGILAAGAEVIGSFIGDVVTMDQEFSATTNSISRGAALIDRAITRGIGVNMAKALDAGTDRVQAFRDAISQIIGSTSDFALFTLNFRELSIAANLTGQELLGVTGELLDNRDQLNLTAAEVSFLREQFGLLNATLFEDIDAVREVNRAQRELAEGFSSTTTSSIIAANEAIVDYGLAAETAAPRISDAFLAIRGAGDTLADALDPFQEATKRLPVSASKFLQNLRTQVEQIATFDTDVIRLRLLGFDDLADEIDEQGPAAQTALTQFLRDLDKAAEAEALLEGQGTAATKRLQEELTQALSDPNISAEFRAGLVELIKAGGIDSPEVLAAIEAGAVNAARFNARIYGDTTIGELKERSGDIGDALAQTFSADDIITTSLLSELTANAQQARGAIILGFNEGLDASKADVGNLIEDLFTQDDALNRAAGVTADTYTNQLVERLGQGTVASGADIFDLIEEAFTQDDAAASGAAQTVEEYRRAVINELAAQRFGFAGDIQEEMQRVLGASNLQIGVDVVPRVAAGSVGSGGGTVIVNNTINNPTTTDLPTATAQLEQSTSSTATLLNRVTQQ